MVSGILRVLVFWFLLSVGVWGWYKTENLGFFVFLLRLFGFERNWDFEFWGFGNLICVVLRADLDGVLMWRFFVLPWDVYVLGCLFCFFVRLCFVLSWWLFRLIALMRLWIWLLWSGDSLLVCLMWYYLVDFCCWCLVYFVLLHCGFVFVLVKLCYLHCVLF